MKIRLRLALPLLLTITVILVTSSRLPADTGTCGGGMVTLPFTDVAGNAFFCQIAEAFFTGLTNGTTPTTYSPKDNVTREQMAAFITRAQNSAMKRGSRRVVLEQWAIQNGEVAAATRYNVGAHGLIKSDGTDFWFTSPSGISHYSISTGITKNYPMAGAFALMVYRPGMVFATRSTSPGEIQLINTNEPIPRVYAQVGNQPVGITTDGSNLWTANFGGSVSRVPLGFGPPSTFSAGFSQPGGVLFDGTSVWVTDFGDSKLKKLDSNGNIVQSVLCGTGSQLAVYDGANIWVPSYYSNSVTVVRAKDGVVLATLTGNGLSGAIQAAFDGERILVTNSLGNSVSLWKAADLTPIMTIPVTVPVTPDTAPYGVCSDGVGFLVTLSSIGVVMPF